MLRPPGFKSSPLTRELATLPDDAPVTDEDTGRHLANYLADVASTLRRGAHRAQDARCSGCVRRSGPGCYPVVPDHGMMAKPVIEVPLLRHDRPLC